MGGTFSANDVEDKRSRVDLVKRVASLLATGTPLEFHGSFIYSALLLAISTNSTPLLPLLLAAGAPLTATTSGLGPLQLAWITPGVTPWVSVVVARVSDNLLTHLDILLPLLRHTRVNIKAQIELVWLSLLRTKVFMRKHLAA